MGRGKSQVTVVKQQINEAMKTAEIIRLASEKVEQKIHEKKSLLDSARQHIGKMIDRVDPIELAEVVATTYLVHQFLVATNILTETAIKNLNEDWTNLNSGSTAQTLSGLLGITTSATSSPVIAILDVLGLNPIRDAQTVIENMPVNDASGANVVYDRERKRLTELQDEQAKNPSVETTSAIQNQLNLLAALEKDRQERQTTQQTIRNESAANPTLWIVAFVLSCLIVRQGGAFLKDIGGLRGLATFFL
jgi:hypothetical protein